MKVQTYINAIPDPATRQALQAIHDQMIADAEANKAAFDGHHHAGTSAANTPLDSGAAAESFQSSLTN